MPSQDQALPNYLDLPDEEFANMADSAFDIPVAEPVLEENDDDSDEPAATNAEEDVGDEDDATGDVEEEDADEEDAGDEEEEDDTAGLEDEDDEATDDNEPPESSKDEQQTDYKAAYEKLTSPFKANGREMQIDNVDDAIRLMQMGANYNRKMAALKPGLKVLKMLENNKLMDPEQLNFLIDLNQRKPEAITKLLKDAAIDPDELDLETGDEYKATNYTVNDNEVELDTVLDEIRDSEAYTQTLDIVGTKWDAPSKRIVQEEPQLLKVINDHVESGVYALINKEVTRRQALGHLNGVSDIQAYKTIGEEMDAAGKFNHLFTAQAVGTPEAQPTPRSDPKKAEARRKKRRAASPAKPSAADASSNDGINPLGMSDEEFEKQYDSSFLN